MCIYKILSCCYLNLRPGSVGLSGGVVCNVIGAADVDADFLGPLLNGCGILRWSRGDGCSNEIVAIAMDCWRSRVVTAMSGCWCQPDV